MHTYIYIYIYIYIVIQIANKITKMLDRINLLGLKAQPRETQQWFFLEEIPSDKFKLNQCKKVVKLLKVITEHEGTPC